MNWKRKFQQELEMAEAARGRGNEGQARVCARRAAGVVVKEYFLRQGLPLSPSAIDLLKRLQEQAVLPAAARQAAQALTMRVTEEFKLPEEVDLLQEARNLAASLLPED